DLSYYCCIELKGEEDKLLAALSQLTSKEGGKIKSVYFPYFLLKFTGSVTVYRAGQYPSQPLGPVTYLWRPQTAGLTHRQLWIWAHPTLKQVEAESENIPDNKLKPGAKRKRSRKDASEPAEKKILGDGTRLPSTPVTWKSSSTGIVIKNVPGFLPFLTLVELPSQDHTLRLCVSSEADEEKRRELMMRGVPQQCCQSFLWDQSVRDNVTDNKISEQELNRTKSELLVPGSRLSPTPPQGRVPILLVHQPGKQVGNELNSWGAGWDLLLPKGWGMAFWIPLVYRGVRVAGLHMSLKHSQNKAAPHFPHDYPDCPAGARFQEEQEAEFLDKFRRKSLRLLSAWCRPTASKGKRQRPGAAVPPLTPSAVTSFNAAHRMGLLWVRLTLLSKGNPEAHAMVCVPTAEDLKLFSKDKAGSGPKEPPHKDHFKSRIMRKKKSSKKAATSLFSSDDRASDPITPKDPQSSSDLILGLWPDPLPSVTSHCSRVTLGWITQGDFSLSVGCGEALGFVSVAGLLNTLLNQPVEHRGKLLLRNPTSLHYRFVKLNIDV
ncbi:hypothetical protein GOODEAATRI_008226, partial [Goodea atripinnis]